VIIDTTYFLNKQVFIPQAVAQPTIGGNTPTAVAQLQAEIDQAEYEFSIMAFGYQQTTELFDQFETNGDFKPAALQKWKDLVDGKEYAGGTKKWNGLRYSIGTQKISLIANYTFFKYLGMDFSQYSTTGVQVPWAENSSRQLPNGKQTAAWNAFINVYQGNLNGRGYSFFSNWNGLGMRWATNRSLNQVTLYEFLTDHPEDYDNSFFTMLGMVNPYNL